MKRMRIFLSVLLVAILLAAPCTSVFVKAEAEQVFVRALGAEPDSLDMAKTSDVYSATILLQVVETLTRVELDEKGERVIVPAAVSSILKRPRQSPTNYSISKMPSKPI